MTPPRSIPAPSRRGLTLLEVVFAVVLLGLVTASVMGALASVQAVELRNRQRLGACEIANRLVLQWLDDKHAMPSPAEPVEYGPFLYFWERDRAEDVRMTLNSKQGAPDAPALLGLDRYYQVTISVFAAEGGDRNPFRGEQLASISRVYDPAAMRNPNALFNFEKNQDLNIQELLNRITGGAAPQIPADGNSPGQRPRDSGADK